MAEETESSQLGIPIAEEFLTPEPLPPKTFFILYRDNEGADAYTAAWLFHHFLHQPEPDEHGESCVVHLRELTEEFSETEILYTETPTVVLITNQLTQGLLDRLSDVVSNLIVLTTEARVERASWLAKFDARHTLTQISALSIVRALFESEQMERLVYPYVVRVLMNDPTTVHTRDPVIRLAIENVPRTIRRWNLLMTQNERGVEALRSEGQSLARFKQQQTKHRI